MLCDEEGRRATEQLFQSLPELGLPDKREWPNQRSHSNKECPPQPQKQIPFKNNIHVKSNYVNTTYVAKITNIFIAETSRYFNFVAKTSKYTFKDTYIT